MSPSRAANTATSTSSSRWLSVLAAAVVANWLLFSAPTEVSAVAVVHSSLVRRDAQADDRARPSPDEGGHDEDHNHTIINYTNRVGQIGDEYHWGEDEAKPDPAPAGLCGGTYLFRMGHAPVPFNNFSLKFSMPDLDNATVSNASFDVKGEVNTLSLISMFDQNATDDGACVSLEKYAICSGVQWCLGLDRKKCDTNCNVTFQYLPYEAAAWRPPYEHMIWSVQETTEGSGKYTFRSLAGLGSYLGMECEGRPPQSCWPVTKLPHDFVLNWQYQFSIEMRDAWKN
eukprot:CAMPEP_0206465218 /NCGR_PEP_ID=MMETSP0324_2-20121206/27693_1 /ASSEMBLY_ACC=CAM_ASM_000836 /TAXON_ID=2866 /ORGANISM="Crypthecodinium cohnii, Strain Seligo" /LENGTH=284 /DNA_ID=CAMNT_0053938023 /DNA_START=170 /DNA_END=1024 /DNA_ORIENTATION=-